MNATLEHQSFLQMCKAFVIFNLMLIYYKYPLKVWLTTIVLGTMLLYLVNLYSFYYAGAEYEQFQILNSNEPVRVILANNFLYIIVYYIFTSIPCWLFFWFTFWLTKKRNLRQVPSKFLVLASGLIAYLIFFCILYRGYEFPMFPGNFEIFFSYAFVLVIAILSFKFSIKDRRPATNENS